MKVITVVGARPQFIKSAVVSRALNEIGIHEDIVHTGQHYDQNMSEVFFNQLQIPQPKYHFKINSCSHGEMTGRMLIELEPILLENTYDAMIVYGDTNSTLAGALAASKLELPLIHIEAGLRSFNKKMPEEINRIMTDHVSNLLFCPSENAVSKLANEGIPNGNQVVFNSGDVMFDSSHFFFKNLEPSAEVKKLLSCERPKILATIHRPKNTDNPDRLQSIFNLFDCFTDEYDIIFPVHPRIKSKVTKYSDRLKAINPLAYRDLLEVLDKSTFVMTDSGGLQKEAYFYNKKCFTLRDETEWVELVESGANTLIDVGQDGNYARIQEALKEEVLWDSQIYGSGKASVFIVNEIQKFIRGN